MNELTRSLTEIGLLVLGAAAVAMFLKQSNANERANTKETPKNAAAGGLPYYLVFNAPSSTVIAPSPSGGNQASSLNPVVQNGNAVSSVGDFIRQAGGGLAAIAFNTMRALPSPNANYIVTAATDGTMN